MTLPPFDLHRARSVEEATELLRRYGEDAALCCGGTELLLLLKLRFAAYGNLIDIKGIEELWGVRAENGSLVIGAAVTHRELERSPLVREWLPALASMERGVGNVRVRQVGTLGGNLCFSDPHSDPATFLLALGAEFECRRGGEGPRRLAVGDFVRGPYQTALERGELLVSVRVPAPPARTAVIHKKFSFQERPAATVTCLVRVEGGEIAGARIAVGSVGVVPARAHESERLLIGAPAAELDPELLERAGELAAEASAPVADSNGSPDYKANLVRVLVVRSLREAVSAA